MAKFNLNVFGDLEPIRQDDGPNPVVAIAYTAEFRSTMDIFRAVLRKGEFSRRVLDLTESILDQNAANYTVWQYRRDCLRALGSNLNEELDFMDNFAEDNPKNYQIWYHRRVIVEELNDASRELAFCAKVFQVDSKNYHAWAHRQWVIRKFGLWEGELEYINELLSLDIRNNSAWNQRWYVVHNCPEPVNNDIVRREIEFGFGLIERTLKNNESAWNYVRGLARHYPDVASHHVRDRCVRKL